mgnify:CR=1 FL=1
MAIPHTNVVIDDGRIEKIAEFQAPETLYDELINRIRKYHLLMIFHLSRGLMTSRKKVMKIR